jgi:uncharacterized membrane protein HdeD (DUF308 family)
MVKRPRSITIISWIFIVFGSIALLSGILSIGEVTVAQRIAELKGHWYVHVSRIVQILCGVFMLYGFNWARWLLVAWLAFHVIVGGLHSKFQLIVHSLLFAVVVYFLFRPQASAYFGQNRSDA